MTIPICGSRRLRRLPVLMLAFHPQASPTPQTTHSVGINALAAANITGGCRREPLSYCPNDKVTRAEMALFLYRALTHADLT